MRLDVCFLHFVKKWYLSKIHFSMSKENSRLLTAQTDSTTITDNHRGLGVRVPPPSPLRRSKKLVIYDYLTKQWFVANIHFLMSKEKFWLVIVQTGLLTVKTKDRAWKVRGPFPPPLCYYGKYYTYIVYGVHFLKVTAFS